MPDNLPSNYAYLSFLIAKSELDLASPVWQRLLKNPIPPDFELKPAMAFSYIDNLLSRNRVSEALQAWDDILRKTETSLVDRAHETLISNGSFENDILRGGFDWRYPDMPEAQFRIDANQRMERLKSMRISFGDANISTDLLSQIAPIYKPGWYILDFYIRSDGLTSDQLPYVVVRGYPNLEGTNARSEQFPSSTDWRKISLPFSVESNCKAVQIALRRDASNKFGNKLKGSLWVDGFKISSSAAK